MISTPGYAGSPAQVAITRCVEGFWSPYSLHCSPHDCGPVVLSSSGLALTVSYPDNTTQHGSQARLSCSLGEIHNETSLTCTKVRRLAGLGTGQCSESSESVVGGLEWAQTQL